MECTIVLVLLMVMPFLGTVQTLKETNTSMNWCHYEVPSFSEGLVSVSAKGASWVIQTLNL